METKLAKGVLSLALVIFKDYAKAWEAYEETCNQYAKEGYRPHYCFHGTNLWTDYDPMCGPCEDGYGYFEPNDYRSIALREAKQAYAAQSERIDALIKLQTMGAPIDLLAFSKWVTEPVQRYLPQPERKEGYAALAECEPPF
jgi:hypothetical protein